MRKAKTMMILRWTLSGILALLFTLGGANKFMDAPAWAERFVNWGLVPWMVPIIGGLEILGGVGLLIPRVTNYAAYGLIGIMVGAAGTHLMSSQFGEFARPIIFLAVLVGIVFLNKKN